MKLFVLMGGLLLAVPCWAIDPYDTFSALPRGLKNQPRVLNTDDVPDLRPHDPQELITPEGDFDFDGSSDIAVSGLYDLPEGPNKYFLLVATLKKGVAAPLYFQEFNHPIFLHAAGTTGPGDPKTQAFSYTSCWNCENGFDVVWRPKEKRFENLAWENRKSIPVVTPTPLPDIPDALIDQALKLVGILPDVQSFVKGVNERNGKLSTHVEWESLKDQHVWVSIFEKSGSTETLYDRILFDGKDKKILKRQRLSSGSK